MTFATASVGGAGRSTAADSRITASATCGVVQALSVHPVVGEIELDCEVLAVPGDDHREPV
ncbi:hypothetical protein [Nonomuraea sp. NPDC050691]|uniref:hypothetical protein n=1 Tax=Nonomuraea sp. NPDC050691 TaxID=3155661 RepID=UPI003407A144